LESAEAVEDRSHKPNDVAARAGCVGLEVSIRL